MEVNIKVTPRIKEIALGHKDKLFSNKTILGATLNGKRKRDKKTIQMFRKQQQEFQN